MAKSEAEVLESWRTDLASDALIAGILLAVVVGVACLLNAQLRFGARVERSLQEREDRFRLLEDNIADIVIVMDKKGTFATCRLPWLPCWILVKMPFSADCASMSSTKMIVIE